MCRSAVRSLARGLVTACTAALLLAVPVPAATAAAPTCDGTTTAGSDVNGDGYGDVVVADPDATVGGRAKAGVVHVRYGSESGEGVGGGSMMIRQGSTGVGQVAETNDRFGSVLATGFVDGDACLDLIIGVPGENLTGVNATSQADAGLVHVVFGAVGGPGQGARRLTLWIGGSGIAGNPTAGDRFGAALAVQDRDDNPVHDAVIAVGAPGRTVGSASGAGAVALVNVDTAGSPVNSRTITQASPGMDGAAEAGDAMGSALAWALTDSTCQDNAWCWDLVVGIPGENSAAGAVQTVSNAGAGTSTYTDRVWTQNTAGVAGAAEAGDRFGAALSFAMRSQTGYRYLAVGVPGEDVGSARNGGAAHLFAYGGALTATNDSIICQDTPGVDGAAETGDLFGSSVLVTNYWDSGFKIGLVVGAPYEDLGSAKDAGAVTAFSLSEYGIIRDYGVHQGTTGIPGAVQAGEHFGAVLRNGGGIGDTLLVGVPDDVGCPRGLVLSVPWSLITGFYALSATAWTASTGTRFGAAIA